MTDQTITVEKIQSTKTFEGLNAIQKEFVLKRENRKLITNALVVCRNTGVVPGNVHGYNLLVVNEIILGESVKNDDDIHYVETPLGKLYYSKKELDKNNEKL